MNPERFAQVDRVLQSVLERPVQERDAFLDAACGTDAALKSEVRSLLASYDESGSFIQQPAVQDGARLMAEEPMASLIGQVIGNYKVIEPIGAGGMGEVYLAFDTRNNRPTALKILLAYLTTDAERVRRFQQEARAVLALNHPNVVTIYEIGQAAGVNFIATELIEGETLRQRMTHARLTVSEAIEIAAQVAGAIAYAHEKGVIHRDIKPENIMLRPDGYAKVLDFGIAKLTERPAATTDPNEAQTRMNVKTSPGMVMGTVQYMSPEQARGLIVDERSDTWSLGCVLYEMLTGQRPFEGETSSDVIAMILKHDPAPLCSLVPEAPAELEHILLKALDKSQDERYQTAKDFLADLRRFKRHYEHEADIERSTPPDGIVGATTASTGGQRTRSGAAESAASSPVAGPATSSAEYIVAGIRQHKVITIIALAVLALGVAGISAYWYASSTRAAIESIAVLPFVNQSRDPDAEYLSDGVTESIINSLAKLPNLKVIARSSVFRYKEKEADPMAVGKELGVRAVLTGRISQRGDSLTISTELLDVRDNKQLWGEQYQRKISDLLAVERDIAKEITGNLRLKLSGPEQTRVARPYTENAEAYQLYLKGRYFWNKFTPADHQRAIQYFNQAIAQDPTYALAYAGLADAFGASATNSWIAPNEGYPKAIAAAKKALELDETLAEAHCALGALTMFYLFDWATAERGYQRAIELNPNYAQTYEVYSYLLQATGPLNKAIEIAKRGLNADPLSLPLSHAVASSYYMEHRYDEALKQIQEATRTDPSHNGNYFGLGMVYEQKGMFVEAIAAYQTAIKNSERTSNLLSALGNAYAVAGKRGEALKILDELKAMAKEKYVSPYDLAVLYTGLGDKDQAIEQLNKAYEERAGWIIDLKFEPLFDPLRSDPRFNQLVGRLNLPAS